MKIKSGFCSVFLQSVLPKPNRMFKTSHYLCSIILLLLGHLTFTSEATIVVLNGLSHENQANRGESYRGNIQIQNVSSNIRSVSIYQRDYWFSYTGESKHDEGGTLERSNAAWINYNPNLVNLAPNEIATISFEVNVPNTSLTGTYWSVLMVEGITPPDTTKQKGSVTINTAIRYAVQIVTTIGETGTNDISFLGLEMGKQEETPFLYIALENTGERLLRPELAVELFDEAGTSTGVIRADQRKTFPGTSIMIGIPLAGIKTGKYTGVLVADCGNDRVFGTTVSLEL